MSLRRFESLYKMFIILPNSVNELTEEVPVRQKLKVWKRLIKEADAGARRKNVSRLEDSLILPNDYDTPEPFLISFWEKVESLASYIRAISKWAYTPSLNVTINEVMVGFRGRTLYKVKFKNKLIKERYKQWCLGDHGYIWSWLFHLHEEGTEGSRVSRDSRIPEGFPETQRFIIRLALTLPIESLDFILYLDNLFTSVPLA
jgi:hypothetical protein